MIASRVVGGIGWLAIAAASAQGPAALDCQQAASTQVAEPARQALAAIDGSGRQLLALRSYLRSGELDKRWSWSEAQIAAYQGSAEQVEAQAQIARVQARFAADNPGYTLYVNLQVRSLDTQLRKWNDNASVAAAAEALHQVAGEACAREGVAGFADWLRRWTPPATVNLAAPGLSAHGQGRAYDFQVMQGDALVAGTDSRRRQADWADAGWGARLAAAVRSADVAFDGPLQSPDEPWHYRYQPPAVVSPPATAEPR